MSDPDALRRAAAEEAVEREVRSGMRLGLGTGATAAHAVRAIAERLRDGRLDDLAGVPTSEATATLARELGIPLVTLEEAPALDVAIDGADEIDPGLELVKGRGGAHLREKVVAFAARRMAVVAEERKLVARLGERAALPVEVIRFACATCHAALVERGWRPALRMAADRPFVTDEGNVVLDCVREDWPELAAVDRDVSAIPGVVAHGLFLGFADVVYAGTAGGVRVLSREGRGAPP